MSEDRLLPCVSCAFRFCVSPPNANNAPHKITARHLFSPKNRIFIDLLEVFHERSTGHEDDWGTTGNLLVRLGLPHRMSESDKLGAMSVRISFVSLSNSSSNHF